MIQLEHIYWLAGLMFAAFAFLDLVDKSNSRRFINAGFWGLFATSFLFGSHLSDLANGVLVLAMIVLGAIGLGRGTQGVPTQSEKSTGAARYGNLLFAAALIVPATALAGLLLML